MEPSGPDPSDFDPSDFVRRWESYLARTGLGAKFSLARLPSGDGRIPAAAPRFLTEAGLPGGAGFRFHHLAAGLRPVHERYGRPGDWSEPDRRRLAPFLVLGSDGGGDPVCLDTGDRGERVVFLDHEGGFAPSVPTLLTHHS